MNFKFPELFDPQPTLQGESLLLRPLAEGDRNALTKAANDPTIWAGHPARDRYQAGIFSSYFDTLRKTGGCLLAIDQNNNEVIGCSAFYTDKNAPSRLSIGFTFLTCAHWGGSTNRAMKSLMLNHIYRRASEAWFHIAPKNLQSQAATKKLGAVLVHEDKMDLGGGPQLWQCYGLTRETWNAKYSENGNS